MKTIISVMRGVWDIPTLLVRKICSIMFMLYVVLTSRWTDPMEFDAAMRLLHALSNKKGITLECEERENSMKLTIELEIDMDMSD